MTNDWIELGRLYSQQGRLSDVQKANESALRNLAASDERTRAFVQDGLGNVAVTTGDLPGAKARYEEGLVIRRKLAKDNPTSAVAQRDLSISLEKLGDVAVVAGDLPGAKAPYEESLVIRRKLAKGNPTSAEAQHDLAVSLHKLGAVTKDRTLLREALQIARSLEQAGRLAPRDHGLIEAITRVLEAIP